MISVLIPTRGRPEQMKRAVDSADATAKGDIELLFYVDEDDSIAQQRLPFLGPNVGYKIGPRMLLTQCWNELLPLARGEILMQGNDDIVFRTVGWDRMVENAFEAVEDKILMVHGSDRGCGLDRFGPHPFVHRRWADALGYFIPPYFSSDFGDTWVNELANALQRRVYLEFAVEHMHFIFGKAAVDQTTQDRLDNHKRDDPERLYSALVPKRMMDVSKLRRAMRGQVTQVKWTIMILTQPSRAAFLRRLLDVLEPQVEKTNGAVDVAIRLFDKRLSLGANRQAMVEAATGEYTNFIDDDDLVPDNYVKRILPLLDGIDYVGFCLKCFVDNKALPPTYHSLRYKEWTSDAAGAYRDISHLNPIRRDLALLAPLTGGHGEDQRWAEALRKTGAVKTEHFVDEVMYLYYCRTSKDDGVFAYRDDGHRNKLYPAFLDSHPYPPCPRCKSVATVIFSNGIRCNQCAHQFAA